MRKILFFLLFFPMYIFGQASSVSVNRVRITEKYFDATSSETGILVTVSFSTKNMANRECLLSLSPFNSSGDLLKKNVLVHPGGPAPYGPPPIYEPQYVEDKCSLYPERTDQNFNNVCLFIPYSKIVSSNNASAQMYAFLNILDKSRASSEKPDGVKLYRSDKLYFSYQAPNRNDYGTNPSLPQPNTGLNPVPNTDDTCPRCYGSRRCDKCGGSGKTYRQAGTTMKEYDCLFCQPYKGVCPRCHGSGKK